MKHLYEFDHYLTEGKNVADSYHFTSLEALRNIIKTGIRFSTRKYEREQQESGWKNRLSKRNDDYTKYISLTRHKDIGKVLTEDRQSPVRITLDTAAITNRYKVVPIDFVGQVTDTQHKTHKHKGDLAQVASIAANAFEERIISPKKDDTEEFLPLQYIKKIEVFTKTQYATKYDIEELRQELRRAGIKHEIHLAYPKPEDRIKTEYNLSGVELEDGLPMSKISTLARKTLSALVMQLRKEFKSDAFKVNVSSYMDNDYYVRMEADLPYYKEHISEATLYTAVISRAGVLRREAYKPDHTSIFDKLLSKPYIFDDYMNDEIHVYLLKDLKLSIGYEQRDNEVIIKKVDLRDPLGIDAEMLLDIIERMIPRSSECSLLLPPELRRFRVETAFENGLGYSMYEQNPNRILYTPPVYKDDYELYKDLD